MAIAQGALCEKSYPKHESSFPVSTPETRDSAGIEAKASHSGDHSADPVLLPQTSHYGLRSALALIRTSDSTNDPGPPPDGGFPAWSQALLCHLAIFNTWGFINSFGIFQTYYTSALGEPHSTVSWVGSVQIWLLFFIGTFSGRALDAGYFRAVFILGQLMQITGVFMTSLATTYWQVFLAQGLCTGIGNGLVFCPSFALLSGYFSHNRALAIGVAASGSATGGVVFPAIAERLLPKIGFPWTVRVIGFVMLGTMSLTVPFFKARTPPRKRGPLVEWAAFIEMPYLLFSISMFLSFWGLYFAFYYIGSFTRDALGASQQTSIKVLMVMNGVGAPGRLIPGFVADRYLGPLNTFLPFVLMASVLLYCWAAVSSVKASYAFAVVYGFFAAGIQSLFLATLSSLTTDPTKTGVRMGMVLTLISLATLTGEPLAGILIQRNAGDYLLAQMFAASSMALGFAVLVTARFAKVGSMLKIKV
ncbi:hypothetical protein MMC16_002636 [Acarospora aff. strigata]|nr:hypothetical protein [Acarospora aff. strigata]